MLPLNVAQTWASARHWLGRWKPGPPRASGGPGPRSAPGEERGQTVLNSPHLDEEGLIAYRLPSGRPARLVYSVAQQAMLGHAIIDRYLSGGVSSPYAEFIDPTTLRSPVGDAMAERAAAWLLRKARDSAGDGSVWLHEFDLVYTDGDAPVAAPWLSGVGQANALLACLHWWRHTREPRWRELACRAVTPFLRPLDRDSGVATPLGGGDVWFEEYPLAAAPHILNCHLLSLIALDRAAEDLDLPAARKAFEGGLHALHRRLGLYDRGDCSRYDLYQRLFLMVRLVPSLPTRHPAENTRMPGAGCPTTVLGSVELLTTAGRPLARLDLAAKPHDRPESRLAGCDWGPMREFEGRTGRVMTNRQADYAGKTPIGGTDQNTYLIFQEDVPSAEWQEHGLQLRMDVFFAGGGGLDLEFRDPGQEDLAFRRDASVPALSGRGWAEFRFEIAPRLIGRPLPRHYHRLHVELLGTLLERHPEPALEEVFQRWHAADLKDIPGAPGTSELQSSCRVPGRADLVPPRPRSIYVFVNARCNP